MSSMRARLVRQWRRREPWVAFQCLRKRFGLTWRPTILHQRNVLTFSSGIRICAGRHLAWVEVLTTLAKLFNAYDVALPEGALCTPDNRSSYGQPVIMPQMMGAVNEPRLAGKDYQAVILRR
ncbi:hypothetical protein GQ54DRAFT_314650 [Martensiomyces pterosporus]|nr:hypothetical protein GQ54DRAFT_314650 [Martensiomyces pterosporus]